MHAASRQQRSYTHPVAEVSASYVTSAAYAFATFTTLELHDRATSQQHQAKLQDATAFRHYASAAGACSMQVCSMQGESMGLFLGPALAGCYPATGTAGNR